MFAFSKAARFCPKWRSQVAVHSTLIPFLCLLSCCASSRLTVSQELHRRGPNEPECGVSEVRIVTKHKNGSYAPGLLSHDIQTYLADGAVRVLNFEPFSHGADPPEPTDLLFVLTPHSDFRRLEMHALAGELGAGESLGVWAAVLGPDGGFSPFTTDALLLERELKEAAIQTRFASIKTWKQAELHAFQTMHHLPGRHIVIRLAEVQNPLGFTLISDYKADNILDYAASLELAPIFELMPPSMTDDSTPNKANSAQEAVLHGSKSQQRLARQIYINEQTAGRSETSFTDLIRDLRQEGASTYKLLIQPLHGCNIEHSSRIDFASRDPSIRVLGPPMVVVAPQK